MVTLLHTLFPMLIAILATSVPIVGIRLAARQAG